MGEVSSTYYTLRQERYSYALSVSDIGAGGGGGGVRSELPLGCCIRGTPRSISGPHITHINILYIGGIQVVYYPVIIHIFLYLNKSNIPAVKCALFIVVH